MKPDQHLTSASWRWPAAGLVALILAALALSPLAAGQISSDLPRLEIEAPTQVEVGAPIPVVLRVRGAAGLAGYEATLRYDGAAAHFSGLDQRSGELAPGGRGGEALGPVELGNGVAFGLVTCAATPCAAPVTAAQRPADAELRLATLAVVAERSGVLELRLDDLVAVDAAGARIPLAVPAPLLVQVGSESAEAIPAPALAATLDGARGGAAAPTAADITGDGAVGPADLMELALAWQLAREAASPCALGEPGDLNGDGCLDVADVQAVAGRLAPETDAVVQQAGRIFTVNSTGDGADVSLGNGVCADASGACTLRAAIAEANRAGADTITFAIPGDGPHTIQVKSRLPTITDTTGPTTIDGYTQPGALPNSDPLVSNASIRVQVRGNGPSSADGFVIMSAGNSIRGLAVFNHARNILLMGSGATGNVITGNFIGTDALATFRPARRVDGAIGGVAFHTGASRNRIGGTSPAERNVISGNAADGVSLRDEGTDQNAIVGNIIGLAPDGQTRLLNHIHGIDIDTHTSNTLVGGAEPGSRNVIAGNVRSGVEISHGSGTLTNRVIGNYIGTTVYGQVGANTGNGYGGVRLEDGVRYNEIRGNLIGGNNGGIQIVGRVTSNNRILENYIGVDAAGQAMPNDGSGILITYHAPSNQIGPGNRIAYNRNGIRFTGDLDNDFNTITRNSIYANTGMGIDLAPLDAVNRNDNGDRDDGPNDLLNFPVIERASPAAAFGLACAGCTVELFLADGDGSKHGQGQTFVGSAVAGADGRFSVTLAGVAAGQYLTATATDGFGNTSEFALNLLVTGDGTPPPPPPPPPSVTPSTTPISPSPTPGPPATPSPTPRPDQGPRPSVYLPFVSGS